MTTGFNAGIDTSDVVVSYGAEVTWATLPAIAFQEIRLTGEGFSETKSRSRPGEIRKTGDAAHAITTQVEASGSLNFALSAGTYDDWLEAALNGSFTTVSITGAAGDISAVNATNKFTAGTGKFADVEVGMWIKVAGFSNANNNGFHRVIAKAAMDEDITVASNSSLTDETPAGSAATMNGKWLRNNHDGTTQGTSVITTFYIQKEFASDKYLVYPGSYITSANVSAQVGDFVNGSFNFLCEQELKATSDQSTGSATAAPTGRVIDSITGINDILVNDAAPAGIVQGIDFTLSKESARGQYGIGSPQAQGMGRGTITLTGTLSTYFKDFVLYDLYKNETDQLVSFRATDDQDRGYIFTIPAATLMNPQVVAGGPDTDVLAEFELEGNPAETGIYSGVTFQVDAFPT